MSNRSVNYDNRFDTNSFKALVTTALGFPISAYRVCLYVNHSQFLLQGHILYPFLTFRDARRDQHISAIGCRNQTQALGLPYIRIFRGHSSCAAVEEYLVLLGLTQEEHVAESAVPRSSYRDAQCTLEQMGVFAPHHVAEWIIAEIALPILQLAVAHENMVVVIGLEEGRAGDCG